MHSNLITSMVLTYVSEDMTLRYELGWLTELTSTGLLLVLLLLLMVVALFGNLCHDVDRTTFFQLFFQVSLLFTLFVFQALGRFFVTIFSEYFF